MLRFPYFTVDYIVVYYILSFIIYANQGLIFRFTRAVRRGLIDTCWFQFCHIIKVSKNDFTSHSRRQRPAKLILVVRCNTKQIACVFNALFIPPFKIPLSSYSKLHVRFYDSSSRCTLCHYCCTSLHLKLS